MRAGIWAKPPRLGEPLRAVVAQTHERAEPESVDVAAMRLDVIADCRRRDDAALRAVRTERVLEELVLKDPRPTIRGVPTIPFCQSAANSRGSTHYPLAECSCRGAQDRRSPHRTGKRGMDECVGHKRFGICSVQARLSMAFCVWVRSEPNAPSGDICFFVHAF
jgi:hypothetical protein